MKNHARQCKFVLKMIPAVGSLLFWTFLQGCNAPVDKDDEAPAAKSSAASASASLSVQDGRVVLTLEAQDQKRLGLSTVSLSEISVRPQFSVPAVVLSAQDLANLRNGYVAAQAQLQKSRASLDVATKEYGRLRTLYRENQNASAKSLEAAQGTMQSDEADEKTAQQQLELQSLIIAQQWGSAVAGWVAEDTAPLERVLSQRDVLVQITTPPSHDFSSPPAAISLDFPDGRHASASFVSTFPRVDPRIQGRAFIYITPAQSELAAGLNLVAHLAKGKSIHGFVIPESALIWSEGQAWIYVQLSPNQFSRIAASTDIPVESGFLMTKALSSGERVVVLGAQALLSEELLLQGQGASAPDTDTD